MTKGTVEMKALLINSVCGIRSTGRICTGIAGELEQKGYQVVIAYGRGEVPEQYKKYSKKIGSGLEILFHAGCARFLDDSGFGSVRATKDFLKWADEYDPDLLWLHNIHGYYINLPLLFEWIKTRPDMEVKWTLHDCWAFTGHCTHFTVSGCDKWKTGCYKCPNRKDYPKSIWLDRSKKNYKRKKELLTGIKNLKLITPSKWLADLVQQSFLKEYPIEVIFNTINRDVFKPTENSFKEDHKINRKTIILGVAAFWDKRKGLDDFIALSKMLDDPYVVVLVGLNKKQIANIPQKIIGLGKTNSPQELAKIYTAADIFVNPSREETFGMTTLEAVSCGTNAIVYKGTACEEVVEHFGGVAVPQGVDNIYEAIVGHKYEGTQRNCQ